MEKYVIISSNSLKFFDTLLVAEQEGFAQGDHVPRRQSLSSMTAVPLDAMSLSYALQRNLPILVPADVIAEQEFVKVPQQVIQKIQSWAASVEPREFGFSCNWLLYDSVILYHLLQSAYMALNMVPFFRENADSIILFSRSRPEFLPNLCCSDIPSMILEQHLSEIAVTLPYEHQYSTYPPPDGWCQDFSFIQDAIAFAYYEVSLQRSLGQIRQAMDASTEKIAVGIMPCIYNPSISSQIVSDKGVLMGDPYFVAPLAQDSDATVLFPEGTVAQLVESARDYFPAMAVLEPMLQKIVHERYTYLEKMYRGLRTLWSWHRPKVCIGENLAQGEYSIPLLVGNELGIPTVSTPHSVLHMPELGLVPASLHACGSPMAQQVYEEQHLDCSAQTFDEVYCKSSYPSPSEKFVLRKKKNLSVLILPGDVMLRATPLLYTSNPRAIQRWVKAIQAIPEKLADSVGLFYKLHPGFGTDELLHVLGIRPEDVIPREMRAEELIEFFDLVVCVEYISSPNQMALEKNIPLVNCVYDAKGFNPVQRRFMENTFTLNRCETFWPEVLKNILHPLEKQKLLARQRDALHSMMVAPHGNWVPTLEALALSANKDGAKPAV